MCVSFHSDFTTWRDTCTWRMWQAQLCSSRSPVKSPRPGTSSTLRSTVLDCRTTPLTRSRFLTCEYEARTKRNQLCDGNNHGQIQMLVCFCLILRCNWWKCLVTVHRQFSSMSGKLFVLILPTSEHKHVLQDSARVGRGFGQEMDAEILAETPAVRTRKINKSESQWCSGHILHSLCHASCILRCSCRRKDFASDQL